MRFLGWLLLLTSFVTYGCTPLEIDIVILEAQVQNGQKAIDDATELGADQLAIEEYGNAKKLLKFAKQAQERGEFAQSIEFANQAKLSAQIALYKAKQHQARTQFINIREQMYQEEITQKDYEIEMIKIRNEMKSYENTQAQKVIETEKQRANALTTELEKANNALRHAEINLPISGANLFVTLSKIVYPEIVETPDYARVQSIIEKATTQLNRKEFNEAEKTSQDAKTQANKLYELAIQHQKTRTNAETEALIAVERAKLKIQYAESLNAATHDPEQYQQAQNQLDSAKKDLEANRFEKAKQSATAVEQIADKVIATSEIAEYRRRAQEELTARIKKAKESVASVKAAITQYTETKVPQFAPQLFELATSALVTAEAALAKKDYTDAINTAQQSNDYLQRAIKKTELQTSEQTSLIEATKQIPKAVVIDREEGVLIRISGNLFATTSTRLKDEYFPTFTKLAEILLQDEYKDYIVRIEGHSDTLGDASANKALSERRANSVKTFLIDRGNVKAERLNALGLGESQPIDKNSQEKNRRIDILLDKAPKPPNNQTTE